MQRTTWTAGEYTVSVAEDASGDAPINQDTSLVTSHSRPTGTTLRLAAIDGVTPTKNTPTVAGVDGAVHAASVVRAALLAPDSAPDCLRAANTWLHDTYAHPPLTPRDLPQATAAVADITPTTPTTWTVQATCSGDAEVWVRRTGTWESLFAPDMLAPGIRAALTAWKAAHPDATRADIQQVELDMLPASAWIRTAIGRFPTPKLALETRQGADAVVVATDGAKLDADRVADLDTYLAELEHRRTPSDPTLATKAFDDLTVIAVTLTHR